MRPIALSSGSRAFPGNAITDACSAVADQKMAGNSFFHISAFPVSFVVKQCTFSLRSGSSFLSSVFPLEGRNHTLRGMP
jgi:hypothetical protein